MTPSQHAYHLIVRTCRKCLFRTMAATCRNHNITQICMLHLYIGRLTLMTLAFLCQFTAQHVSDVNKPIFRSLRLLCALLCRLYCAVMIEVYVFIYLVVSVIPILCVCVWLWVSVFLQACGVLWFLNIFVCGMFWCFMHLYWCLYAWAVHTWLEACWCYVAGLQHNTAYTITHQVVASS